MTRSRIRSSGRAGSQPRGNLKFAHDEHGEEVRDSLGADSTIACMKCHAEVEPSGCTCGARHPPVLRLPQHPGGGAFATDTAHVNGPEDACSTCHLTLVEATELTGGAHRGVPDPGVPRSGREFRLASTTANWRRNRRLPTGLYDVAPAARPATPRDFCLECHVDAPNGPASRPWPSIPGRWRSSGADRARLP
jgi:hypothetical protein